MCAVDTADCSASHCCRGVWDVNMAPIVRYDRCVYSGWYLRTSRSGSFGLISVSLYSPFSIPNLDVNTQGPVVGLKARSLLPSCHFELQDSDYISGARRNPELRGPNGAPPGSTLDPMTRVVEFHVVGVGAGALQ